MAASESTLEASASDDTATLSSLQQIDDGCNEKNGRDTTKTDLTPTTSTEDYVMLSGNQVSKS